MAVFNILIFLIGLSIGSCLKEYQLPSYIKTCARSEKNFEKCCLENARDALPYIVQGDKNYSIPSFLPFRLNIFSFKTNGGLDIVCTDLKVYGFETLKIHSLGFDLKGKTYYAKVSMSSVTINSKYEVYGQEVVLPVDGQGNSTVSFGGIHFNLEGKFHLKQKQNEEYMVFERPQVKTTIKKAHFRFENLFGGEKQLDEEMNKSLNDDWKKVIEEVNPSFSEGIVDVALGAVNSALDTIPYAVIFPEK